MTLLKSIFHNLGVLLVGSFVGAVGLVVDTSLDLSGFYSPWSMVIGTLLLSAGFVIRVWATYLFYEQRMRVIVLEPQHALITHGPYRFSRNPLYLGGNVFIFFGAAFFLGSASALVITLLGIFATDVMIRREEKQLEQRFGEQWLQYKRSVRRWL